MDIFIPTEFNIFHGLIVELEDSAQRIPKIRVIVT